MMRVSPECRSAARLKLELALHKTLVCRRVPCHPLSLLAVCCFFFSFFLVLFFVCLSVC